MRLLATRATLALLLLGSMAARAASVAVAPIRDTGKKGDGELLRKQVERGLTEGGLTVVGLPDLLRAAADQGFSPADLGRPAVLIPVTKAAGADAVLVGVVDHPGKKDEALQIRVFNLEGVELWSRAIPLKKGKLDKDVPKKIARAVGAALAAHPEAAVTPAETPKPEEAAAEAPKPEETPAETPKPVETPKPEEAPAETPKPRRPPVVVNPDDESAIAKPPPKPVRHAEGKKPKGEGEVEIEGPPVEARLDTTPAPPYVDMGAGGTVTFRTYKLCPGVSNCSQPGPAPTPDGRDVPISYTTTTPYGGVSIWAEAFPVPKLAQINDTLTFTVGLMGEFSQSLVLKSQYQDPVTSQPGEFKSSERRIEASVTGRLYFSLLGGTGNAGLFGGLVVRKFSVEDNPLISESSRLGAGLGATTEVPLFGEYVKATGRFTLLPALNPGITETTLYGQTGRGGGFDVRGGLTGNFISYVGYSVLVDYTKLSDVFDGAGEVTTTGAVAEESYLTIFFMLHGRF